jgi:hypothetical protein
MGLRRKSIEAYCLDEAVIYFGLTLENMLEEAGTKPGKADRKAKAAREALMKKVFGDEKSGSGFADPAAMFQ